MTAKLTLDTNWFIYFNLVCLKTRARPLGQIKIYLDLIKDMDFDQLQLLRIDQEKN